jgi:GNAT superfamily N-acetyltransferase
MTVEALPAAASADDELVGRLTDLVNEVYRVAEDGLWVDGAARTDRAELRGFVAAGEILLAGLDGAPVGCLRRQRLDERTGQFGMLAADPAHRGVGVGRALVRAAEQDAREAGRDTMQLELLMPRTWRHPSKEFLHAWYTRLGYRVRTRDVIDKEYPHLAPLLATPCDYVIYRKTL